MAGNLKQPPAVWQQYVRQLVLRDMAALYEAFDLWPTKKLRRQNNRTRKGSTS